MPNLAEALLSLARFSRKLETIAILVDAEKETPQERIKSIVDSLKSRNIKITKDPEKCCKQTYKTEILVNNRKITLIISVSGIYTVSKEKHTIEDHMVKLIGGQKVVKNKQQILEETLKAIEKADIAKLNQAFPHIHCMIINIIEEYYRALQELNTVDKSLEIIKRVLEDMRSNI